MVRHAPIHRRSGHSDIAICCGRNVRGSSPSTSVVPLSNQVTTLNHKRFKGFKMFSDGHLMFAGSSTPRSSRCEAADRMTRCVSVSVAIGILHCVGAAYLETESGASCGSRDFNVVAEISDAVGEPGRDFGWVTTSEVVGAEISVASTVAEHVIDGRED